MSWSINFIGKPEKISEALKAHSDTITGPSKEEYDAALPHIDAIVNQNYGSTYSVVLKVDANGSGHGDYRSCNISITSLGGQLV